MKTKIESLRQTDKNFILTCEIIYLHTVNSRKLR